MRSAFVRRLTLGLVLTLALAACGSVPQPFRGTPKASTDNPLIDVPAAMGVSVMPIAGLPGRAGMLYAKAIAERLLAMDIPSEAVEKPGGLGFTLYGKTAATVMSPGGQQVDMIWTLKTRKGAVVGEFTQAVRLPPEDGVPTASAGETSEKVASAMGLTDAPGLPPVTPGGYATAKNKLPTISVKPVENAPGDGRESLRLAILQALVDGGAARDDINPDIKILGQVDAKTFDFTSQQVAISWRAILRDGRELGEVKLENVIPNGALDGSWGPTAFAIAAAAQPDLLRLLAQAPTDSPAAPPKP